LDNTRSNPTGGLAADPARQYPAVFGDISLFKRYPYLLATFIIGLIMLVITMTSAFFVKEVLIAQCAGFSN